GRRVVLGTPRTGTKPSWIATAATSERRREGLALCDAGRPAIGRGGPPANGTSGRRRIGRAPRTGRRARPFSILAACAGSIRRSPHRRSARLLPRRARV